MSSIRFDASGDYLSRTANLPTPTAFTACGWAKRSSDTNTYATVFALQNGTGSSYILLTTNSNGDDLALWGPGDGSGAALATLSTGTWFFWAIKCAGTGASDIKGYYATAAATSLTTQTTDGTGASFTADTMKLANDNFSENFNGTLAAVKVWDAVLTDAEIERERWSIRPRRFTNLNVWAPMWPGSGVRNLDYSGNGRNWTVGGTLADEDGPPVSYGGRPLFPSFVSSGGVSGTIAVTLEDFTSAFSGTQTQVGTIAPTMQDHTAAFAGTQTQVGTMAPVMEDHTSAFTGATTIVGTIAQTLENFTSAISGTTTILGTIAVTLQNWTSAMVGTVGTVTQGRWFLRMIGSQFRAASMALSAVIRRNRNNG